MVITIAALVLVFTRQGSGPGVLPTSAWQRPSVSAADLEQQEGVRVETLATTGAGGLLDLRFTVLDGGKANSLHDEQHPPAIVDESTGLVANSLLMGHAHTAPYHAGARYYLVFENPGNLIKAGAKVSVLLGNAQLDDVVVK
jgi:hypothetical protein